MRSADIVSILALCVAPILPSCSASDGVVEDEVAGGPGGEVAAEPAALTFALTDAASDELETFELAVLSVEISAPGANPIELLPQPMRVDLAQLSELSRIASVAHVPAGRYSSAAITFDFGEAAVHLVDQDSPATILGSDGEPLDGAMRLPISLGFLEAVAGENRLLECDFDLDRSLLVDAGANTVTVEPVLTLAVDPDEPKEVVAAGELLSVDENSDSFVLQTQTFGGTPIAELVVGTSTTTVYQIDGIPYVGRAGLTELASRPAGTWVQAYGSLDPAAPMLHAAYLEAGTGTYNGGSDIVEGHVTGRIGGGGTDPILTVLGRSNNAAHDAFQFNTAFLVTTSLSETAVIRRGSAVAGDTDDLNIGQRVRLFGTLLGSTLDASNPGDVIRLQPTRFLGFANAEPSAGELEFELVRVGPRDESIFLWDEGGSTPPDPTALVADVSELLGPTNATELEIGAGTAVEVRGFVSAIDDDGADFEARRLLNRDNAPSLLSVLDRVGGMTVTPAVSTSEILLAIDGTPGLFEHALILRGFVGSMPLPNTPTPAITALGTTGHYSIRHKGTHATALFLTFEPFATALETELGQGSVLFNFGAVGLYDAETNGLAAKAISVVVK